MHESGSYNQQSSVNLTYSTVLGKLSFQVTWFFSIDGIFTTSYQKHIMESKAKGTTLGVMHITPSFAQSTFISSAPAQGTMRWVNTTLALPQRGHRGAHRSIFNPIYNTYVNCNNRNRKRDTEEKALDSACSWEWEKETADLRGDAADKSCKGSGALQEHSFGKDRKHGNQLGSHVVLPGRDARGRNEGITVGTDEDQLDAGGENGSHLHCTVQCGSRQPHAAS